VATTTRADKRLRSTVFGKSRRQVLKESLLFSLLGVGVTKIVVERFHVRRVEHAFCRHDS
jgi:hypothetical protein